MRDLFFFWWDATRGGPDGPAWKALPLGGRPPIREFASCPDCGAGALSPGAGSTVDPALSGCKAWGRPLSGQSEPGAGKPPTPGGTSDPPRRCAGAPPVPKSTKTVGGSGESGRGERPRLKPAGARPWEDDGRPLGDPAGRSCGGEGIESSASGMARSSERSGLAGEAVSLGGPGNRSRFPGAAPMSVAGGFSEDDSVVQPGWSPE